MQNSSNKPQRFVSGIERCFWMQKWLDATLYPDIDPPSELTSLADRVDFLARLCAAWDFGVVPYLRRSMRFAVQNGGMQLRRVNC